MSRRGRNVAGSTPVQPGRGMGEDKYLDTSTPAVDTLYSFMSNLCAASVCFIFLREFVIINVLHHQDIIITVMVY